MVGAEGFNIMDIELRFQPMVRCILFASILTALFGFVETVWLPSCLPVFAHPGDCYIEEEGQFQVTYQALYGFCDENGKVIVSPRYYSVSEFHNGLAVFKEQKTQLAGVLDLNGKVVIPAQFDELSPFPHGNFLAKAGFPRKKIDGEYRWQCDGLWGLVDRGGKWLVKPTYDSVGCIQDGDRCHVSKKGRAGFCDSNLQVVIPPVYEDLQGIKEGFIAFASQGKMGFLDKNGKSVVPATYKSVGDFSEGFAKVQTADGWGFIDTTGRVVIPCHFRTAKKFEGGRAEVDDFDQPNKTYYIDRAGKRLPEPVPTAKWVPTDTQQQIAGRTSSSSVGVPELIREAPDLHLLNTADYQIRNESGQTFQLRSVYDPSKLYENRLVYAEIKVVSRTPTKVEAARERRQEIESECADPYITGEARKRRLASPKCYGFKNASGQVVIPAQYREATAFSEGLAAVRDVDYWSYIDKTGAVRIRTSASVLASPFYGGLAAVSKCSKEYTREPFYTNSGCLHTSHFYREGLIDLKGRAVCDPKYENLCGLSTERILFAKDYKWGVMDRSGKVIVEPCYGGLQRYSEGLAAATVKCWSGGLSSRIPSAWGYIDLDGKLVIPHKYEVARAFHDGFALVGRSYHRNDDQGEAFDEGFIDKTGRLCIKSLLAYSMDFNGGVAVKCVGRDKQQSYDCSARLCLINTSGEELTKEGDYHEYGLKGDSGAVLQSEGIIPVRRGNLWGFIDLSGKELVKPQFLAATHFKEGLAAVSLDNHNYFYIDRSGKVIVAGKFLSAGAFADGRAIIEDRLGRAVIDKTGRRLFDASGVEDYSDGLYLWKDPAKSPESRYSQHSFD